MLSEAQHCGCDLPSRRSIQYESCDGCRNASQDGDFAIAKALQEQERAFMALQRFMHRDARSLSSFLYIVLPLRCCDNTTLQVSSQDSWCRSVDFACQRAFRGVCLDASMLCREDRRAAHGGAEADSEEGPDDADDKEGSADLSGAYLPPAIPSTIPSLAAQCSPCRRG